MMSQKPHDSEVRPIRWSRDEIGSRPVSLILLLTGIFFIARLPHGWWVAVVLAGLEFGVVIAVVGELGARTQALVRSDSEVVLRRRWRSPLVVGVGGQHRVLRLPAPGDSSSPGALLWVNGAGHRTWLAQSDVWPVHDVEMLAEAAGLTIEDGVAADLARAKASSQQRRILSGRCVVTVRYRTSHGIRSFYVNVAGWAGSLLALFALTTPTGEFGRRFAPVALIVGVVAICIALRGRSLGVEVTRVGLVAHGFWRRTELTGELRSSTRTVRPGKTWILVSDGTRTVTLPLIVNIGKPLFPGLNLYALNVVEARGPEGSGWRSADVAWGTQAMVDLLGIEYPELPGTKPSRAQLSRAASAAMSLSFVGSMSALVAYSVTRIWPLLVVSAALMLGASALAIRGGRR